MKIKVGIEGFTIDSAHYTLSSPKDDQLHGHTYTVSVEVEGDINEDNGFVVDFNKLRNLVNQTISLWDHKFIVPKKDFEKINIASPFRVDVKLIEAPYPTVEYIGIEIAKHIYNSLGNNFKISVKIYEGRDSYAIVEYP
ncbi:6-pyruvoyl tetrahydropterin synthase family protein [Metallosphaera sp.]|uniref:6-pyruvoyl trahydropterin synthase family protein n=1 Tax=Metallosphaera sp. TaxID=2020860 RepID=UPI00315ECC66